MSLPGNLIDSGKSPQDEDVQIPIYDFVAEQIDGLSSLTKTLMLVNKESPPA
jgi:hypothetical protein